MRIEQSGGVVADSDPAAEFAETVAKSEALVQAAHDAGLFLGGRSGGN